MKCTNLLLVLCMLFIHSFANAQKASDGEELEPCEILTVDEVRKVFNFSKQPIGLPLPTPLGSACEYFDDGVPDTGAKAIILIFSPDHKFNSNQMKTFGINSPENTIAIKVPVGDEAYFLTLKNNLAGNFRSEQFLHGRVGSRYFRVSGWPALNMAILDAAAFAPNKPADAQYLSKQREAIVGAARMVAKKLGVQN